MAHYFKHILYRKRGFVFVKGLYDTAGSQKILHYLMGSLQSRT